MTAALMLGMSRERRGGDFSFSALDSGDCAGQGGPGDDRTHRPIQSCRWVANGGRRATLRAERLRMYPLFFDIDQTGGDAAVRYIACFSVLWLLWFFSWLGLGSR